MTVSSSEFVKEIQQMVRNKHSKNHPIIGMIEEGTLDREQLKGFIGQFYLFFPKPFPKPIAAMLSRCPDDPELEKMWIENVVEEGTGEITGTDSHKGLFIRFARACGNLRDPLPRPRYGPGASAARTPTPPSCVPSSIPSRASARPAGGARGLCDDRAGDRVGRDAEHLAVRGLTQASPSVRPAPERQPLDQRHESVEVHRLRHV